MLDTHYVVFVTKIMFSNIILPILSFRDTKVPDFASRERERDRERETALILCGSQSGLAYTCNHGIQNQKKLQANLSLEITSQGV